MSERIGLVIQGPLLSVGRNGGQLHETPAQLVQQGGLVRFDCRQNIQQLIDRYGSLFAMVVVSTREDHLQSGDGWRGAVLVAEPDIGAAKIVDSYKDNNKFRQFRTTLRGLEELQAAGIGHAVKIRTDQHVDLDALVRSYRDGCIRSDRDPQAIFASAIHRPTYMLHDLYFAARTDTLASFCESILAYDRFEFMASVHRDMVLKHAYARYRDRIGVPERAYFPVWPPNGVSAGTRRIFDYMFEEVFRPLDPAIFRSTVWRGALYGQDYVAGLFDNPKKKPRAYDIPALVSTDWDRYFAFKRMTVGRRSSLADRARAAIGKRGWTAWDILRRTGGILWRNLRRR
jgi:hypothetical protein